jgi:penicillin-binding protein 1C
MTPGGKHERRHAERPRRMLWAGSLLGVLFAFACAATLFLPIDITPVRALHPSGVLLDRHGATLHSSLNAEESWCFPRTLDAFGPHLIAATLAAEDQRFWTHPGVDPVAMVRAAWRRLGGGVRSGASTLTMQVVNLAGHDSRSWRGKLLQMHRALRVERHLDKDTILALYLNKAPYGLNLIGAEAAAQRYFGKPARELTLPEAALLAGLPKAPSRYQPFRHPEAARARRAYVLRRMAADGSISPEAYAAADAAPLGAAWHDFPKYAPHLAKTYAQQLGAGLPVQVTLDRSLQERIESQAARYLKRFDNAVTNAAVMVVDAPSGEVLARVGSAGFHTVPGGQVDICTAPRSPGSTLKPFTYALAIERGLLYPTEKLLDDTIDFGSYAPENFDGIFNGLVSAAQALQLSLNVPAVAALDRVGLSEMQTFLQGAGISTLVHAPAHYGLGLTLGNCGIRLDELTAAYTALANLGEYRPLRIEAGQPLPEARAILRPDTALALYGMLEHPFPREPAANLVRASNVSPRVCWKTGTSTGYHDAWTVAFNRQYVVTVWVGNADGKPSSRLVGALAALPLAGSIFRALPASNTPSWPDTTGLQRDAEVCSLTGLPSNPLCPHVEHALLLKGQYLNRRCDVHRPAPGRIYTERWPADARNWDLARIGDTVALPMDTASDVRKQALKISAPSQGATYILTGEPGGDRVLLRGSVDDEVTLHWYLNGAYLGSSAPGQPLYLSLSEGEHRLTCMAPAGESDTVQFKVKAPGDT